MILRYGGRNFACFKDDFEIDLRLNKNCPQSVSHGNDYAKTLCIKGANGAGKTNALKALCFICDFLKNSFGAKPDDEIAIDSYFHNESPVFLFCEFRIKDVDYRYEISIDRKRVIDESLFVVDKSNRHFPLFKRSTNAILECDDSFAEIKSIKQIRANASLVSLAHQYEMGCIRQIYAFFDRTIYNVGYYGFHDLINRDVNKFYYDIPDALEFTKNFLVRVDTGISNITIQKYRNAEEKLVYYPVFEFFSEGCTKKLRIHHQSEGTRRLYQMLAFVFHVMRDKDRLPFGSVFIADELDLHLHSQILPELTKLFDEADNTQLIFNAQNDQIMDSLGKYRTVLINKEENESYSYRLDSLPSDLLRNSRPVMPHYEAGSIGGVPRIE